MFLAETVVGFLIKHIPGIEKTMHKGLLFTPCYGCPIAALVPSLEEEGKAIISPHCMNILWFWRRRRWKHVDDCWGPGSTVDG